jgi:phosphoglycolate phosphatase-like HAD superfamily hydrolase
MNYIALDFDGTLISAGPKQTSVLRAIGRAFKEPIDSETVWHRKRNGATTSQCLLDCGIPQSKATTMVDAWIREVEKPFWLSLDTCFNDTHKSIKHLKEKNYRLILITARSRQEWLHPQLQNLGLKGHFDKIFCVSPYDAANQKAKVLNLYKPKYFIGDTETDQKASAAANVNFIALSCGQRSAEYLRRNHACEAKPSLWNAIEEIMH